jgi:hypothetical protein
MNHCCGVLAGKEEGGFAWLTLNYLLDHLGKDEGDTIAAIDLGGGSVQQAYALSGSEAKTAPEGYVTQLSGGGRTYEVYVHRYGTVSLDCVLISPMWLHLYLMHTRIHVYTHRHRQIRVHSYLVFVLCMQALSNTLDLGLPCGVLCMFGHVYARVSVCVCIFHVPVSRGSL